MPRSWAPSRNLVVAAHSTPSCESRLPRHCKVTSSMRALGVTPASRTCSSSLNMSRVTIAQA
eukprot:3739225-Pyramimonas_sp.AAC.1